MKLKKSGKALLKGGRELKMGKNGVYDPRAYYSRSDALSISGRVVNKKSASAKSSKRKGKARP